MKSDEVAAHARRLGASMTIATNRGTLYFAAYANALDFLRKFAGTDSEFYIKAKENDAYDSKDGPPYLQALLIGFAEHVENGLVMEITPEQQAQLDVFSDIMGQAHMLLSDKAFHPAAAAILIGASLEEFLRTWVETAALIAPGQSISAYVVALRSAGKLDKQDEKDITAWAGLRNDAAHGCWEKVESAQKIELMLQGVNLFMRKYQSRR